MKVEAVFFDCDGVIADNEKEAHQVAFNQAFKKMDLDICWNDSLYSELIKVGGGKERIRYYFDEFGWPPGFQKNEELVVKIHELKSAIYQEIILTGKLSIRPGINVLMHELADHDVPYAICSTSKEKSVNIIAQKLLDKKSLDHLAFIIAGDMVKCKKPDPEIYLLAAERLKVNPANCLVIEDSETGLKAGKASGMKVVVTKSHYSKNDIFREADLIFENLQNITLHQIVYQLFK